MSKKVVRLTESDLVRLVKKIVKEQQFDMEEKHYEYDPKTGNVLLIGASSKFVKKLLTNLPKNLTFLALIDCDFADFDGIDLCGYERLVSVRLSNTENNFEDQNYECVKDHLSDMFLFKVG